MRRLVINIFLALTVSSLAACSDTSGTSGSSTHDHHEHGDDHAGHSQAAQDKSTAVWKLSAEHPQAQSDTTITVQIQDDKGKPVGQFDISHEKLMHLIIVSKDLSYFDHIHPEYKGAGQFDITTRFPAAGDYKIFADYIVTGSEATTKSNLIKVHGTASAAEPIVPDQDLTKTVSGKAVTLTYDELTIGKEVRLNFHFEDVKSKQPITDIQPYLGAVGHVVILSEDAEQYLHVHPANDEAKGPDASFMTKFPKSGVYKIWGQFRHNGQTFIVPYVVNVP